MKAARDRIEAFCRRPDAPAALLYGDPALVAERRDQLTAAASGGDKGAVTRIEAETLRDDPGALDMALRSRSFFAERRCAVVIGAADGAAKAVAAAIEAAAASGGAAFLLVTAGGLKAGGGLRKLFEAHREAVALPCHADPLGAAEIADMLEAAAAPPATREALALIAAHGAGLDRGALRSEIEKLALYARGAERIDAEAVARSFPAETGGPADAVFDALATGRPETVRAAYGRARTAGVDPEALAATAVRRFRQIVGALALMEAERCGAEAALGRLRPPVRFPASKAVARTLAAWRMETAAQALSTMIDLQAGLRGGSAAASAAKVERALIRIALSAAR